jgi:serine/tyrosine/threonine adenylyltransferase
MPQTSAAVLPFDNSYARLPDRFYARLTPTRVAAPRLIRINDALARELGIDPDALRSEASVAALAGNGLLPGSVPLAQAYAGHQFGGFNPQLGDGRAILLGEVIDRHGQRRDIQLKGSGPTPFSRRGDGRAALGPVLREYIISEAMHALGIPTTRSLAAVLTGEDVFREKPLPGAVLTRVAASHIRIGTFQYFAVRRDVDAIRVLADHVIDRHDPEATTAENRYSALLAGVIARQAERIAQWMHVGFIHGVMNTDNSTLSGETIDYGPCAFMDAYDPATVYSSIDQHGRYAYANQPGVIQWNLVRLAETLLPILSDNEDTARDLAQSAINAFPAIFETAYAAGMRRKLGLNTSRPDDLIVAQDLLAAMAANKADYTLTFRRLADAAASTDGDAAVRALFTDPTAFDTWVLQWRARLAEEGGSPENRREAMRKINPAFIPRNHRVEEAITAAVDNNDYAPFEKLLLVLARPFDDQPENADFALPPERTDVAYKTYCGT